MPGLRFFDRILSAGKRFRAGTHRARPPGETLERARRLMRPLGITRLADLTGLDDLGVPVFSAIRPNGRSLSTSQGKGLDATSAAVSALMESIETWHAEHIELPIRRASWRQLRERALTADLRQLPRNRRRVDLDLRLDWLEAWDLVGGEPIFVPRESVSLDTVFPGNYQPFFDVSSNGLASGNHLLEAMSHALCEIIERDAEARWRAARADRRLDLGGVVDLACRGLLDRLAAAGVRVTVWDMTSDVGVPVYGCSILENPHEPSWRGLGLYQGFGCHLEPEVALARALTEAVQTRVTYIAGSRDDFFAFDYERATDAELLAEIWEQLAAPAEEVVGLGDAPRLAGERFEDDVATLVERLVDTGSARVIACDLSRAELGVAVVKCLVPGRATAVELMG